MGVGLELPLVTVGELHVERVAAQEGLGIQWDLDVGGVGDGVADEHQEGHRGRLVPTRALLRRGLVQLHVARAVEHLEERGPGGGGDSSLSTT